MTNKAQNNSFNGYFPTWCPGCGNFGIWAALKSAFKNLGFTPENFAAIFGIGCSGNMNDFLWVNSFHALHGRAIPNAIGVKIANHNLPVVAIVGDGDCYGEGGNHLIHASRGNHDITVIVHDNRVYGLTTGQVAPTALKGFKAKSTPSGSIEIPLNPIALAIITGASFVGQGFSGDINHLVGLIEKGMKHKGFSLINVFQPCVTFNPQSSYAWYRERIYKLGEDYDPKDVTLALGKAMETEEKIPIGVIYEQDRPTYTQSLSQLGANTLYQASTIKNIDEFASEFV